MKKLKTYAMMALLFVFSGAATADQYSLPAVVSHITVGSTGNWYFYPITAHDVVHDYTGAFTDPDTFSEEATDHVVANPAGCSNPTRYVLDAKAGNYDEVIDALKIFGTSQLQLSGGVILVGGFQFYVSSSKCSSSSPKIIRLRYLPAVLAFGEN